MTQPVAGDRRRHHANRTAHNHAAFFTPHLRPGMRLLDLGCGPGTVTAGLAERVAPAETVGFDLSPERPDDSAITLVAGDIMDLPFPDAAFDAIFISAVLQHLPDPLGALRQARRVARPGAVIGVVDADWDGQLMHPTNPVLEQSLHRAVSLRQGTSPFVGRRLRGLLTEAGFSAVECSARVLVHGTPEETEAVGRFTASLFEEAEFSQAWIDWGNSPDAFLARLWIEAVGRAA